MRQITIIKRPCAILIGAAIVVVLLADVAIAADAGKERAALIAAEKWLVLVDEGEYADSWKEAAEAFKSAVTQEQWEHMARPAREPLGKIISRKFKRSTYQSAPPDGKHIMIWYATSFQNGKNVVERVGARLGEDGRWKVAGYIITAGSPDLRSILMALLLFIVIIGVWYRELHPKRNAPGK